MGVFQLSHNYSTYIIVSRWLKENTLTKWIEFFIKCIKPLYEAWNRFSRILLIRKEIFWSQVISRLPGNLRERYSTKVWNKSKRRWSYDHNRCLHRQASCSLGADRFRTILICFGFEMPKFHPIFFFTFDKFK